MFSTSCPRSVSKGKQQVTSLKNDLQLFSWLYKSCETKDGNLAEFFRHENQACPPALSDGESLHLGSKSDPLTCFQGISHSQSKTPVTTSVVIDGAVVVQILKLGTAKTLMSMPKIYSFRTCLLSFKLPHAWT